MTPDIINATFELLGGFFILHHCWVLHQDKMVRGVSIMSVIFFTAWGGWNLYYYPFLGQWASTVGALFIMAANILYVSMLLHYKGKQNDRM